MYVGYVLYNILQTVTPKYKHVCSQIYDETNCSLDVGSVYTT